MSSFDTTVTANTTASVATVTIDVANAQEILVEVECFARDTTTDRAYYHRIAAFKVTGGTLAQMSSTQAPITIEDDATWNLTIDSSGNDIRVRGTADAANNTTFFGTLRVVRRR